MKKAPFKAYEAKNGRKPIVGTMASESKTREAVWYRHGCNIFSSAHPASQPLSFWTNQDVLQYLLQYNVPYCPVYGEIVEQGQLQGQERMFQDQWDELTTTGESRTGCMFCMFGCHLEKEPNRFQRMKTTHPKQYEYCMDKLGLKEVLDYIGVPYE
jgi:3'-phosphoadenosine 5'-phosphosulfate sulfotransferase (PAPS reductase)/FAD synthetase